MNLLLIGINPKIKDILVSSLLPKGFPVYSFDFNDDILGIIQKKEINVAFIDVDGGSGLISYLNLIKQVKERKVSVIVHTEHTNESEIKVLIENGVTAYIAKTPKTTEDIKKFLQILMKYVPKQEQRKALRVKIEKEDNVTLSFTIPNTNRLIKGTVIELSYLGMLYKFDNPADMGYIKQGDVLSKIVLNAGSKRAVTDVEIIMTKGEYVGAKFIDHNDTIKAILIKYIYEKMSKL